MIAPSPAPLRGRHPRGCAILRVAAPPLTKAAHRLGRRRPEETIAASHVWMAPAVQEVMWRGVGVACSHVSGRLVQSGGLLAQGEFRASMTRNPTPLSR